MALQKLLLSALTALAVASCGGGGGGNMSAGGIGGTGVSYGPVTGFGSVIVNGVEYNTDSASFNVEGVNGTSTQANLAVGMVVSVTHDNNGNAKSVSYKNNVEGPVSNITTTTFDVLGIAVTVDNLTVYDGTTGIGALSDGDIVEVSGNITGDNAVRATRVKKTTATCPTAVEVKGTITAIIDANSFTIGSLTVSYGDYIAAVVFLKIGDYVDVKSSACPAGNAITASSIGIAPEGPDLSELDSGENALEIKGVVADFKATVQGCTFTVNGQPVSADNQLCAGLVDDMLVEVRGQLDNSGTLVASEIKNEDSETEVSNQYTGQVVVDSHPTAFEGTIHIGASGTISVDLATQFESETQAFNLDTMAAMPACAEVQVDTTMHAISIHEESCH